MNGSNSNPRWYSNGGASLVSAVDSHRSLCQGHRIYGFAKGFGDHNATCALNCLISDREWIDYPEGVPQGPKV